MVPNQSRELTWIRRLSVALSLFCSLGFLTSIFVACIGGYLHFQLSKKTKLVEGYNDGYLPAIVLTTALVSYAYNLFGLLRFNRLSNTIHVLEGLSNISNYSSINLYPGKSFFRFYFVIGTLACGLYIFGYAGVYLLNLQVPAMFAKGISSAMWKYKDVRFYKEEIDALQTEFKCCGNSDFQDWFHVSWIHETYLNVESHIVIR